jgi:hypothetical protein
MTTYGTVTTGCGTYWTGIGTGGGTIGLVTGGGGGAVTNDRPQFVQNLAVAALTVPQLGQIFRSGAPQWTQKFTLSAFCA